MTSVPSNYGPRRRKFYYRSRVREISRAALIECEGDVASAIALANKRCRSIAEEMHQDKEMQSIIGAIILAVFVKLVSDWIVQFIQDWNRLKIYTPSLQYNSTEPGYEPTFEDDES